MKRKPGENHMTKRSIGIATAAAALVLSAAPAAPAQDGPPPAAIVNMTFGLKFDPPQVRVRVGEAVEWRNKAIFKHTVTFDPSKAADPSRVVLPAGAEPFDSGEIDGGKSWRHVFTVPGRYEYVCRPHEDHEMRGVVIVTPR